MAASLINHADIVTFAEDKINISRDYLKKYRNQVENVRNHIERYIQENPDTGFVKTLLSGSLAKNTALKFLDDIDVALYVKGNIAPSDRNNLLGWIVEQLQKTYPQKDPSDIQIDEPCVTISFQGTGLDVDIMPVYDENDGNGKGYIWTRYTGEKILTSIPMHIDFIRSRSARLNKHFTQIVRLVKMWRKKHHDADSDFFLPSFILELLAARLADESESFTDYPEVLRLYFAYIVKSELKEKIVFTDYYSDSEALDFNQHNVQILDPINPENNVAAGISDLQRSTIIDAAEDALDAIISAKRATTLGEAKYYWREVFGSSFN